VSEEKRRCRDLGQKTNEICRDHHAASGQSICPDTANDNERRPADREGGQYDPEPGRPAADPQDRERERHRNQRVADRRAGSPKPQQPERPLGQRPETSSTPHVRQPRSSLADECRCV
jgi:hypothetical protein